MPRVPASLFLLGCCAAQATAQDLRLESRPTRWRVTAEEFGLDPDEDLHVLGVHLDVLGPLPALDELYAGVGGFAALAGERGGFHALGASVGLLAEPFPGWSFDLGLFAGGAGGGGGAPADGLLLREHLALERVLGVTALRLELAYVDQPEEDLDDLHMAVGFSLPSEILVARRASLPRPVPAQAIVARTVRTTPRVAWLGPRDGARHASGGAIGADVQMLGIGFDYFVGEHVFLPIEAYGAVGGGVAGFALAMGGVGLSARMPGGVRAEVKGLLGAAGGGDVDAGGGFGAEALAGLRVPLGRLALELFGGRLWLPDGEFDADVVTAGLSWSSRPVELALGYPRGNLAREGLSSDEAEPCSSRLMLLHKTYDTPSDARREDGTALESPLHLVGVGAEQSIAPALALTVRAFSAYDGDVGGYGEGQLGLRYEFYPLRDRRHAFSILGEVGAAGGGGVDVGSGLVFGFAGGYRYQIVEELSLSLEAGRLEANRGSFEGEAYVVGLAWDLTRAHLSR